MPAKFGGLVIKSTVTHSHFLTETAQVPTELQYFQVWHSRSHTHQHPNSISYQTVLLSLYFLLLFCL